MGERGKTYIDYFLFCSYLSKIKNLLLKIHF